MDDLIPVGTTEFALFTTADATQLGLDRKILAGLRSRQQIESVCRGVYAAGTSDLSPETQHRRLASAGLLLYPDAAVSHASSLSLRVVPIWPALPARVDLVRPLPHEVLTQSFRIRPRHGTVERVGDLLACDVASSLIHFTMDAGPTSGTVATAGLANLGGGGLYRVTR